jgi:hypothetical protein
MPCHFVTFHVATGGEASPAHIIARHADYLRLLDMMIRSLRRIYPDSSVTILSSADTDLRGLTSEFIRENHPVDPGRLMEARALAQQAHLQSSPMREPILFLDSDMLLNEPLDSLFDEDFDVALTIRAKQEMPINGGFMLINNRRPDVVRAFFARYIARFVGQYSADAAWYGDQLALRDVVYAPGSDVDAQWIDADGCRVRLLPCSQYNHSPRNKLLPMLQSMRGRALLHFKGNRKRFMPMYWHLRLRSSSPPARLIGWAVERLATRLSKPA